jgi:hypothetical protein
VLNTRSIKTSSQEKNGIKNSHKMQIWAGLGHLSNFLTFSLAFFFKKDVLMLLVLPCLVATLGTTPSHSY